MNRRFAALVGFAALMGAGCQYSSEIILCDQIPEGGCPTGRGGTCDDPLCEALYECVEGVWQRTELCEGNTGGAAGSGGASGSGGTGGTGGSGGECTPIEFDHSAETTGCEPPLQSPDCPAAAAEACPEQVCLTGCFDFFLCTDDGWTDVAYCDEDGNFYVLQ
ncbi:MAG: hypothetical protein R3B70_18690 [Polyangiaceae bacterium]